MGQSLNLPDPEATASLAAALRRLAGRRGGWTILLQGELGAGKSTFARQCCGRWATKGWCRVRHIPWSNLTLFRIFPYIILIYIELRLQMSSNSWAGRTCRTALSWLNGPNGRHDSSTLADIQIELRYEDEGRAADLKGLSERGSKVLAAWTGRPDSSLAANLSDVSRKRSISIILN